MNNTTKNSIKILRPVLKTIDIENPEIEQEVGLYWEVIFDNGNSFLYDTKEEKVVDYCKEAKQRINKLKLQQRVGR